MINQILIVDDHPAVRMTVRHLLENDGCTIIGEADNGEDAVRLTRNLLPDTLVLDIGLPHIDGLAVIDQLTALRLSVKIVVLTARESSHFALRCARAGAHGFVNKHQDLRELVNAVRAVRNGLAYFDQQASPWTPFSQLKGSRSCQSSDLTLRELEVLQQLAQGLSNKQIAERMSLSSKTVSTYKARLMIKLNACTLPDLHEVAIHSGLVDR